jgi:hypothetical protein
MNLRPRSSRASQTQALPVYQDQATERLGQAGRKASCIHTHLQGPQWAALHWSSRRLTAASLSSSIYSKARPYAIGALQPKSQNRGTLS